MTDDELLAWARMARAMARSGPMYGLWDLIFDAEAHAHGKQALLPRDVVETMIKKLRRVKQ